MLWHGVLLLFKIMCLVYSKIEKNVFDSICSLSVNDTRLVNIHQVRQGQGLNEGSGNPFMSWF